MRTSSLRIIVFAVAGGLLWGQARPAVRVLPARVPPKRSTQIRDGFGINSNLPRDPYLPWTRWWWTRMFDAGVSWIRIGQYENSSDYTSWDWMERKRGEFGAVPELEDYIESLTGNHVQVQVQLMYGNPMYTSPSGRKPDAIAPKPGDFHNDDRSLYSIFWPPKTPEQITAFSRYVRWIVNHFRGRVRYWALWNEQDIGYWNPWGDAEEYGRLLKAFVPAVHESDPEAKVIYGGQADPTRDFARRALDVCQCAAGIDVFAYHTYPGYGQNMEPESMDYGAYGPESPAKLREMVRAYPGIRRDIAFWDDEFNSIPSWRGSDESVQQKYVTRGMVYNWAAGVKTFVWLLTAGTDGNEYDDFGLIHGLRNLPDDFTPRPVFQSYQNTNALFSDTRPDSGIRIVANEKATLEREAGAALELHGFRSNSGKAIVAYWLAAHSVPGNAFPPQMITLMLEGAGIAHPVLIDVATGEIRLLEWKPGTKDTLEALPVRDSVLAIADQDYFDWPVLPEAPSGLQGAAEGNGVQLRWEVHGSDSNQVAVERREGANGTWQRITTQPSTETSYTDAQRPAGSVVCYRVRALNDAGESAFSNILRIGR